MNGVLSASNEGGLKMNDQLAVVEEKATQNQLQVIEQREVLGNEFCIYGTPDSPLFLAKDVAEWIEHSNMTHMMSVVDEDEKLTYTIRNSGQNREMWFLTEDGLYEVRM